MLVIADGCAPGLQQPASRECEIAIVGGVNVIASSAIFQSMGDAGALSADGTCKTFDDRADGYGRGEVAAW
ncbi:beta-ketoacyl synthase N-terminal-like domain-containing protein [Pseudomonas aeruginosa]|nr:beta-ketoacyl synthase N-terminal-like domain-containing protein [Pseudomonas aeruginosa]